MLAARRYRMRCISPKINRNAGFTLVEIMVVAPFVILVITSMVALIIILTGDVLRIKGTNDLVYNTQKALDQIEQDVKRTTEFRQTSYAPTSPQGQADNAVAFNTTTQPTTHLILRSAATTKSPDSQERSLIYKQYGGVCSTTPYTFDIVYFTKETGGVTSLWRRVVFGNTTDAGAPCTGTTAWQAPSCTPGYTNTTVCKSEDSLLLENVSAVTVEYLNATGEQIHTAYASSAEVSLTTLNTVAGRESTYTGTTLSSAPSPVRPSWSNFQYNSGWADYSGGYSTGAYTITSSGVVILKGLTNRVSGSNAVIATLPVGYRPSERLIFEAGNNGSARVDISTDGAISFVYGSSGSTWVSLEGISFIPSGSRYTFTPMSFANGTGWVNYGNGYTTAGYTVDDSGRTQLRGLVTAGASADDSRISTLTPQSLLPDKYLHISTALDNAHGGLGLQPTESVSGVVAKGGGNSYLSLNSMFYPSSFSTYWTPLPTYNGWVNYGSSSSPDAGAIKGSDGIVSLRGLVRSGSTGQEVGITYLPVGFRPAQRTIISTMNGPGVYYARIDIRADGWVVCNVVPSNGWLSLSGINFVAEQ